MTYVRILLVSALLSACGPGPVADDCAALTARLQPPPAPLLQLDTIHATVGHAVKRSFREALRVDDGAYYFHVEIVFSELARAQWQTDDLWSLTPAAVDVGAWPLTVGVMRAGHAVETRTVPLCVQP